VKPATGLNRRLAWALPTGLNLADRHECADRPGRDQRFYLTNDLSFF
jgi:hypothetical protein